MKILKFKRLSNMCYSSRARLTESDDLKFIDTDKCAGFCCGAKHTSSHHVPSIHSGFCAGCSHAPWVLGGPGSL